MKLLKSRIRFVVLCLAVVLGGSSSVFAQAAPPDYTPYAFIDPVAAMTQIALALAPAVIFVFTVWSGILLVQMARKWAKSAINGNKG